MAQLGEEDTERRGSAIYTATRHRFGVADLYWITCGEGKRRGELTNHIQPRVKKASCCLPVWAVREHSGGPVWVGRPNPAQTTLAPQNITITRIGEEVPSMSSEKKIWVSKLGVK